MTPTATEDDSWPRWFTERHSLDVLARWACGLRHFRFCHAYGGHSNDGDLFLAALRYDGEADLFVVLGELGVTLETVPVDYADRERRGARGGTQKVSLNPIMQAHPAFLQPGQGRIADSDASVWVGMNRIEVSVSDESDVWNVSESAFESARRIEALLGPLADRLVDPPRNDRYCLCPAFHPDVFAGCV